MTKATSPYLNQPKRSEAEVRTALDPRDPDHSRKGIFVYHNCWKCKNGELPCVTKSGACEYPHARND